MGSIHLNHDDARVMKTALRYYAQAIRQVELDGFRAQIHKPQPEKPADRERCMRLAGLVETMQPEPKEGDE